MCNDYSRSWDCTHVLDKWLLRITGYSMIIGGLPVVFRKIITHDFRVYFSQWLLKVTNYDKIDMGYNLLNKLR